MKIAQTGEVLLSSKLSRMIDFRITVRLQLPLLSTRHQIKDEGGDACLYHSQFVMN